MQRTLDWLKEAQAEFKAAKHLYEGGHWSWCCFTCQQAAEKALKAICEHFRTPQTGHNLNLLLKAIEAFVNVPEEVRRACAHLNRYYIPTRYPNAFDRGVPAEQFFDDDAQKALEEAKEVIRFAEGIIGTP